MQLINATGNTFVNGNPATQSPGTPLDAAWFNAVQAELVNFIQAAGIAINPADNSQLLKALTANIVGSAPLADTGKVNAYTATNVTPLTAQTLVHGTRQRVTIGTTNTGQSTYAPDGLPAKPILGTRLLPFRGGELVGGLIFDLEYIVNAAVNGGNGAWYVTGGSSAGTQGVPIVSISALPASNIGPVMVSEVAEIWTWSTSAYYTGYRSLDCGNPVFGASSAPSVKHLDLVGGNVSKTAYPGLWGWAQEQGLVVTSASWTAGTHYFVDLGNGNFQLPDLRNQFWRATGTNADTANARVIGSAQPAALANHQHTFTISSNVANPGSGSGGFLVTATGTPNAFVSFVGGSETRPSNISYAPRVHI